MKTSPRIFRSLGLFLLALTLVGCAKENLYQDLTEQDANEILVALYDRGVSAKKERVEAAQDVHYIVSVSKSDINEARKILVDNNLPRARELGFSGICKEKGLIPTPEEEKCRKLLALKGEIINSLQRIPGVIDADVVLNIPEVSEFNTESAETKKPTASAVIKVRKDLAGEEVSESRIQRFISNTVENLDPRSVAVVISFVDSPNKPSGPLVLPQVGTAPASPLASIAGLSMGEGSVKRFKVYAVVMLLLLISVSAGLIWNVLKMTKMRQELKVFRMQSGSGATPLLEEAATPPQLPPGEG